MHVSREGAEAKYWLDPEVRLARNRGFSAAELRKVEAIIERNLLTLRAAWDDYFGP